MSDKKEASTKKGKRISAQLLVLIVPGNSDSYNIHSVKC